MTIVINQLFKLECSKIKPQKLCKYQNETYKIFLIIIMKNQNKDLILPLQGNNEHSLYKILSIYGLAGLALSMLFPCSFNRPNLFLFSPTKNCKK